MQSDLAKAMGISKLLPCFKHPTNHDVDSLEAGCWSGRQFKTITKTPETGEKEGLVFRHEIGDLSKQQATQPDYPTRIVTYQAGEKQHQVQVGPTQFSTDVSDGVKRTERIVLTQNMRDCSDSLQTG